MDTEGQTPLTDLLNDEPSEAAPVTEAQPAEPQEQPRDENGRFAPKGDEQGASPAPVEEPPYEHAAVKGERTRRQEAERERDDLRTQLAALKTNPSPQQPQEPPPSIWEDDQAWQQHFGAEIAQRASFNAKLDMSEMLSRQSHEDFDDMKASFLQLAEQNPAIVQQALADPHPWDRAYKIAKNAATMAELGVTDVETLREKIREEVMAEMQSQPAAHPAPGLPPTLSTERNVGSRAGPAWAGPTPLSDLLA